MRRLIISSLLLACLASPVMAKDPQRGVSVMPSEAAGSVPIAGDYWALIIGIDQYRHDVPKLETAVRDAQAVRDVLIERYGFRPERITTLLNGQATREAIEDAFYALGQKARPTDSVFIYYAGHGQTDSEKVRGWWVPVDGKAKSPGTFISNARIRDEIAAMKAKHVYLVADSCFSGTLFGKARDLPPIDDKFYSTLYANKSRWGLTSGMNEPVADAGKEGHSIFAYFFLKYLKDNREPYLAPSDIYKAIARVISNNAEQQPVSQPLKNAGDEDGQFVFRLASASGGPLPSAKPAMPSLSTPPVKDVDVSGYADLDAVARLAEKREEAWGKVQSFAGKTTVSKDKRLAALDKFLADFADDNPHVSEAEALKQQINAEMHVASLPTPSLPRQTGREITGKDGAPMLLVPEGDFLYGANKQRQSLSAFYMDKYEVTTKLYAVFLQATGRVAPEKWNEVSQVSDGDRPVIGVDWHDADAYCRYYGKRLPTEQEWEKAARGTDGRKYPWGNEEPTSRHANFGKCCDWKGYATLTVTGDHEAGKSPYGIYDLAGNVWEWTSSDYDSSNKVLRGGSWFNEASLMVSTYRLRYTPTTRNDIIGFRCAQGNS